MEDLNIAAPDQRAVGEKTKVSGTLPPGPAGEDGSAVSERRTSHGWQGISPFRLGIAARMACAAAMAGCLWLAVLWAVS